MYPCINIQSPKFFYLNHILLKHKFLHFYLFFTWYFLPLYPHIAFRILILHCLLQPANIRVQATILPYKNLQFKDFSHYTSCLMHSNICSKSYSRAGNTIQESLSTSSIIRLSRFLLRSKCAIISSNPS